MFYRAEFATKSRAEAVMPIKKHGLIIESPTEARQAEPGPSILLLLTMSTISAVVLLAADVVCIFPYLTMEPGGQSISGLNSLHR